MIGHLSQKHSVVVASLAESQRELRAGLALRQYCDDLIAEVLPRPIRWMRAWKALFSRVPSSVPTSGRDDFTVEFNKRRCEPILILLWSNVRLLPATYGASRLARIPHLVTSILQNRLRTRASARGRFHSAMNSTPRDCRPTSRAPQTSAVSARAHKQPCVW
jgi:hypothetical protein